jgi:hypothetical protein
MHRGQGLQRNHELEQGDRSFRHKHNLEQHNRERVIGKRNIGDLHWKEESDLLGEEVRERDQIGDFDANGVFLPSSLSSVPETAKEDAQEKAGDFGAFGVLPMYIQPTLTSRKRAASAASKCLHLQLCASYTDHNNHRANHSTLV